MNFNVERLILEGPDLSGKSSLYDLIHEKTEYKWNIQDRSSLSMVCYAVQYKRDTRFHRQMLYKELSNLNNRMIILFPSLDVLIERYRERGDTIQTLASLKNLYNIFDNEIRKIQNLPNVFVFTENLSQSDLARVSVAWTQSSETASADHIGNEFIKKFVTCWGKDTDHRINLTTEGMLKSKYDRTILDNSLEGEYYREILSDFEKIIQDEFEGNNEYNLAQTINSRRFYYGSRSCISSLHFKVRKKKLFFLCTLRSTDVIKNAAIDFEFLELLVHRMGSLYFSNCEEYQIGLNINSAHIRCDL